MTTGYRRLGAIVAAAALASVALGACGGDDQPSEATTTAPIESLSATESTTAPTTDSSPDPADPTAYLPVPDGVELTAQGSELDLEQSAVVAWQPQQDLVGVLDITVTRIEQTTFADSFEGWQLDAAAKKSSPYFVHATITNVGDTDVGDQDVPLYAVDATDTLVQASTFLAKFEPCPGNGVFAQTFGPDATKEICLVYLIPKRGELTAVSFRPSQEFNPITWDGPIMPHARPGKR